MKPYIYKIFDLKKNRVCYVGKHNGSIKNYITSSTILLRYIKLFGLNTFMSRFKRDIIEFCTLEDYNEREEYWICYYNTCKFFNKQGLNRTRGGRLDIQVRMSKKVPVLQYTLQGIFIQEYESGAEAARVNSLALCTVNDTCRGRQKTGGGFIWQYKLDRYPLQVDLPSRKNYKQDRKVGRAFIVSIDEVFYDSIKKASEGSGIPYYKVVKLIKSKKIGCFSKKIINTNTKEVFNTIEEASKYYKYPRSTIQKWLLEDFNILNLKWFYESKS
jgi:hypothetical protein